MHPTIREKEEDLVRPLNLAECFLVGEQRDMDRARQLRESGTIIVDPPEKPPANYPNNNGSPIREGRRHISFIENHR